MDDFNGAGIPDLAAINYQGNTVSILVGNGDGTFKPQVQYVTGSYPVAVAVGDFNGDGKLDLATTDSFSNTVSVDPPG
ncbi:MAG TPA: VCBS repeat-containing protein [Bryobacteraceae bacterium]|nr:VCBS repeat-containing protein [Bryobacteraceae bacterium]